MFTSKHEMALSHLSWVSEIARRVAAGKPGNVDLKDLRQDGILGLMDALERYDPDRGVKLETFAAARVQGAMIDGLRKGVWPRGLRRQRRELKAKLEESKASKDGFSVAELAAELGTKERALTERIIRIRIMEATKSGSSIDEDTLRELPSAVFRSEYGSPEDLCEQSETARILFAAIAQLSLREQEVIRLYFYEELTSSEIGDRLGVVESRVSQIRNSAIRRLRVALTSFLRPASR